MKGILLAMLFFFGMEGMAQSESLEEQVLLAVMAVGPEGAAGNPIFGGTPMPRTPPAIPNVSIDDHTLNTGAVWFDATLQVLDENENVVYTTFVPAGTPSVVLPSTLSGDYELRLIWNNWRFYGYISL